MKGKIKNKIALVTGASRGLGRSISKSLAKAGAELILVGRTISALEELDDEVKSMGSKSTIVPMDLEDNEAIDILGSEINKKWGEYMTPIMKIEADSQINFPFLVPLQWHLD